jgi:hypothetical protein
VIEHWSSLFDKEEHLRLQEGLVDGLHERRRNLTRFEKDGMCSSNSNDSDDSSVETNSANESI